MNDKGVTLILVLAFILAVVILANVALVLITSQARFTQHKVGRIQAIYAAQAGINYALEQLRAGEWGSGQRCIGKTGSGCDVLDNDIPYRVDIEISDFDANGIRQVKAKANYSLTN